MSGGWLFGYVQALQLTGFQITIFCFSSQTRMVASMRHQPTGAEICLIPATEPTVGCGGFTDLHA